jgi:hypothetical protein
VSDPTPSHTSRTAPGRSRGLIWPTHATRSGATRQRTRQFLRDSGGTRQGERRRWWRSPNDRKRLSFCDQSHPPSVDTGGEFPLIAGEPEAGRAEGCCEGVFLLPDGRDEFATGVTVWSTSWTVGIRCGLSRTPPSSRSLRSGRPVIAGWRIDLGDADRSGRRGERRQRHTGRRQCTT